MNRERKAEILAPAGSYESFRAAILAGADAVYAIRKFVVMAGCDGRMKNRSKEFFKRADACGDRRGTSSREKVLSDCQYVVKRTGDGGAFCISGTLL